MKENVKTVRLSLAILIFIINPEQYPQTDHSDQAEEKYHAIGPSALTLVLVPDHANYALTFSLNSGKVSSEVLLLPRGVVLHLVVLTEEVPVQPAAAICSSPARHLVLQPLQELSIGRLGRLGKEEREIMIDLNQCEPISPTSDKVQD